MRKDSNLQRWGGPIRRKSLYWDLSASSLGFSHASDLETKNPRKLCILPLENAKRLHPSTFLIFNFQKYIPSVASVNMET